MRFAASGWMLGALLALAVAVLLVVGAVLLLRARRRFGDEARIAALLTGRTGVRRAIKGVLTVLALALAFLAAAQPQYGRGTRRIPATNLDVAIVLDYSKSMYARDVKPSRIERAKSEVASLVRELPGARFAAVAFAGEPIRFPLTSDGAAVAQFFRQLTPNDMPVGGTAIARALSVAQEVLRNDPLANKHQQVVLLVTDGEDLEGDPVAVAELLAAERVPVHVVQIGGRTPEPIPEIDAEGEVAGYRVDDHGQPLTTALSAEGEATLLRVAEAGGGSIVRSATAGTGITEVAARLRRLMTEELSEKVETVYADVFHLPLGLALLLLLAEGLIGDSKPARRRSSPPPPPQRLGRGPRRAPHGAPAHAAIAAGVGVVVLAAAMLPLQGCDVSRDPFVRHSPIVDEAIGALDAGNPDVAVELLQRYLGTGRCEAGEIGAPESLADRSGATLDLGIGLFQLAERFGQRFGEEEAEVGATPPDEAAVGARGEQVRCALRVVRAIAHAPEVSGELRAKAHYLAGNLEFLRKSYRDAVAEYDQALRLVPGRGGGEDSVGNDAAHNRAVALRRQQDQPPEAPESEASPEEDPDAGEPDGGAPEPEGGAPEPDGPDGGAPEPDGGAPEPDGGASEPDAPDGGASEPDAPNGGTSPPETQDPERSAPPPAREAQDPTQDERTLDQLEEAPTLQQHDARQRAREGRVRRGGMADK